MKDQALLDVRNVEICYEGEPVVREVTFQMQPGEILGIVGESGSGKSTLIRAAMGLLGNRGAVTKGEIFLPRTVCDKSAGSKAAQTARTCHRDDFSGYQRGTLSGAYR